MSGPQQPWPSPYAGHPSWVPTGPPQHAGRRAGLAVVCAAVAMVFAVVVPLVLNLPFVRSTVLGSLTASALVYGVTNTVPLAAALVASLLTRVPFAGTLIAVVASTVLSVVGFVAFVVLNGIDIDAGDLAPQVLRALVWGLVNGLPFLVLDLLRRRIAGVSLGVGAAIGAVVGLAVAAGTAIYVVVTTNAQVGPPVGYVVTQSIVKIAVLTLAGALCGLVGSPRSAPAPGQWGSGPDRSGPWPPAS